MQYPYPFESVLVRNRSSQAMSLYVCPFSLSQHHVCVLVALTNEMHRSTLSKNADHIVSQLRERFSRKVKSFSMIELQHNAEGEEEWHQWRFNWVGNMPLEPKSEIVSSKKQDYYRGIILGHL